MGPAAVIASSQNISSRRWPSSHILLYFTDNNLRCISNTQIQLWISTCAHYNSISDEDNSSAQEVNNEESRRVTPEIVGPAAVKHFPVSCRDMEAQICCLEMKRSQT